MKLYSYFRSSAAFRLRIALNLKNIAYEQVPVSLLKSEQLTESFKAINPLGLVPVLEQNSQFFYQSLAICEYLEETYPQPPLLPIDSIERASVRGLALTIACEIHPINNLRVLKHLKHTLKQDDEQRDAWYRHWIIEGFTPIEHILASSLWTGCYCHKDVPGLADIFLIPQVANAIRYKVDLSLYPTVRRIYQECLNLPAFANAQPHLQPDAIDS